MNEFQATMVLCVLDDIDKILEERRKVHNFYIDNLSKELQLQKYNKYCTRNYAYFPVVFETHKVLGKYSYLGAGGFAREAAWLIEEINNKNAEWNLLGFIEKGNKNLGSVLNNYKIFGDFKWLENNKTDNLFYIYAVGDPKLKSKFSEVAEKLKLRSATLIHPDVKMSSYNVIGEGTIIYAGSIITVNVKCGKHVVISVDSKIGHDSIIGDFSTLLPSVVVSGNVKIGTKCIIGTSGAIICKLNIGSNTIVRAGATVIRDLPNNCTAVGIPASPIKFN